MTDPVHIDYPEPILSDWRKHFAESRAALQIWTRLPQLNEEIERLEKEHAEVLAALKAEYQQLGKQQTAHQQNADTLMEVVQGWCGRHGVPLPNEPVDPEPAAPVRGPHDAGIWERKECVCGQTILRDKLTPGARWGHPGNGSEYCDADDRNFVAEPLSERDNTAAVLVALDADTSEEAKTDD